MYITEVKIDRERFPTRQHYPFNVPAIQQTPGLALEKPVVFFVGENGSGKSTLLDAITRKCGIHIWDKPRRHLAHENPFETKLASYVKVKWANGRVSGSLFRAETFHDLADFLDDVALCDPGRLKYHGGQILNTLSHGEGMLSYFRGRFQVKGLYFLDEPESALSPASQLQFLKLLQQLGAEGRAQFIIATHSPILLACPGAQILCFDGDCIREVRYQDTAHYQIYRQFFAEQATLLDAGGGGE
jgi:predicted ATPase